jgi:hypothetical protein
MTLSRSALLAAAVAGLAGLGACTDFDPPAVLTQPQILDVVAEPPMVPPGGTALLTVIVADQTGRIAAPDVTWEVTPLTIDAPPLGRVDANGDGTATYTAPDSVEESPTAASVQATVVAGGRTMVAVKGVGIGDLPIANPRITAITAGGEDVLGGGTMALPVGSEVSLAVVTDPPATEESRYAWYASLGTIDRYQSSPTEILAESAGTGVLLVVVRDGRGGSAWAQVAVTAGDGE